MEVSDHGLASAFLKAATCLPFRTFSTEAGGNHAMQVPSLLIRSLSANDGLALAAQPLAGGRVRAAVPQDFRKDLLESEVGIFERGVNELANDRSFLDGEIRLPGGTFLHFQCFSGARRSRARRCRHPFTEQ
jgi:hypothetical protein